MYDSPSHRFPERPPGRASLPSREGGRVVPRGMPQGRGGYHTEKKLSRIDTETVGKLRGMSGTVHLTLPVWLAIAIAALALWAALERLLLPSFRWLMRRRVNRVLEEIHTRLKIRIPPLTLTKREVL